MTRREEIKQAERIAKLEAEVEKLKANREPTALLGGEASDVQKAWALAGKMPAKDWTFEDWEDFYDGISFGLRKIAVRHGLIEA